MDFGLYLVPVLGLPTLPCLSCAPCQGSVVIETRIFWSWKLQCNLI